MTDEERARIAREALAEITTEASVGELVSQVAEGEGVTTLSFAATMPGYPGWHWTVSVAELPDEGPSVLEAELLPGDGALLAPDWVPWSERLEEYRAAQAAAAAAGEEVDEEFAELSEGDDDTEGADADDDELDGDDDFGVDPDDGIDFEHPESAVFAAEAVHVDEGDEAEADADEAGPQPPDASGLDEGSDDDEQPA
ncbi:DUF3027 domain-containing protein [Protaetiibacter mangrovi]|uniref:DUF3027 domain-containing protein n=1 Tax=Protaetiibacter mangrovi TaxID=2970926 RepID=A0ABT1ZDP6_9MICO|nr:DUF3027 domain-containing protein [Protaetiibacter mangrovi]MCS0498827.1 DUF3027 domain-containing protein [Protaetiibacter mangrovi]